MADKRETYRALVAGRKRCTLCQGLQNPASCAGGEYDSEEIGPWTRWQGALDAELMVVGQDWGSVKNFETQHGRGDPKSPTNQRLRELLKEAGFPVNEVGSEPGPGMVFLTNAILCLKSGGASGSVEPSWFAECGSRFLRPQIELVRPRAVVTLGEHAYKAACHAFELSPRPFREAVESQEKAELLGGVWLFPVYHCSLLVLNTRTRTFDSQKADWRRIGVALGRL
jgi:uracil-DNA glycosylase